MLDGRDIEEINPIALRRRVGLVFQLPMILEGSVRDNLLYGTDQDVDVEGGLGKAGLDCLTWSGRLDPLAVGEAQRLAIAPALVRDPDILLMDEPTSPLDRDPLPEVEELVARPRERSQRRIRHGSRPDRTSTDGEGVGHGYQRA